MIFLLETSEEWVCGKNKIGKGNINEMYVNFVNQVF